MAGRRLAIAGLLSLGLAGCAVGPARTPSSPGPRPTMTLSPVATVGPSGSSPGSSVISVPGWGELWASMPAWFLVPAGSTVVPTDTATMAFSSSLDPAAALAAAETAFEPLGFSVESRADGPSGQAVYLSWDQGAVCETAVVVTGEGPGSRVAIRYPTSCPR